MTSSLKFKITEYFLALFASSFRVTEEDWLSETAVWPNLFLLNVSTALKGTHNYILLGRYELTKDQIRVDQNRYVLTCKL